ncbi:MAG: hypothetical protein DBP03_01320 [gamma proteobacterium symbiont of Ctena orbiculata]|nr:MAG: hypothetical protein DBP03_01320 [gamma proteobacterium symbiont of Ctena orbiculata]
MSMHCGTYEASDKSGSAFDGVLREIRNSITDIATELDKQLEENEYVLISEVQAKRLLQPLNEYRIRLIEEIGHDDFNREIQREEDEDMDPLSLGILMRI